MASSGNFYHTHNDVLIPGLGTPLSITRYYNSQELYDGPFGHGWNMDYTARLVESMGEDGTEYATIRLGNGVRRKFTRQGDGSFLAPSGQDDTLTVLGDGTFEFNGTCGTGCQPKPRNAFVFNSDGSLAAIRDINGNAVTIAYDVDGRIGSATDANSRSLTFAYGSNGRISTITDFSGREWSYGYDGEDNLVSVTDPLQPAGNTIQYTYDDEHNLTGVIDARGNLVSEFGYTGDDKASGFTDNGGHYTMAYDPVSKVTAKTNPAGGLFQFNYDDNGNITNKTGPEGLSLDLSWDTKVDMVEKTNGIGTKTAYGYDGQHNVTAMIMDEGPGRLNLTTAYVYDPATGQVSQLTDPEGNITAYTYDTKGNLLTRAPPIGTTSYEYDSTGSLTKLTGPDGVVTRLEYSPNGYLVRSYVEGSSPLIETAFTYDTRGNRLTKTDPNGNTTTYTYDAVDRLTGMENALGEETSFTYDANGNPLTIADDGGTVTQFTWDAHNRVEKRTDDVGGSLERETTYAYDTRGNLLTVTGPLGHITSYAYDDLGRQVEACDHLNQCWVFGYDAAGNQTSRTDPNVNTTTYSYDAVNRLVGVTDAESYSTTYTYDGNGRLLTVTDANSHIATTNTYDGNGRIQTTGDALGYATTVTYTLAGRLATKTDANGNTTTYTYDATTGRLETVDHGGGKVETFVYDLAGNLTSVADSATGLMVSFTYDALNRVETETQLGQTLTTTYDVDGNRATLSVPGVGTYTYTHDSLNRLTAVLDPHGETTQYAYDAAGRRVATTYGNGAKTVYSFDAVNRLTAIVHEKADASVISSVNYSYDAMNNRLSQTDMASDTITYHYDDTYKLIQAVYGDTAETIDFVYDGTGNRYSRTDGAGVVTYTYDAADRLNGHDHPDGTSVEYAFDDNGNLQTRAEMDAADQVIGTTAYSYDQKDQLIQIVLPDATVIEYTYDPLGRRTRVNNGTAVQRFLYDGQNPVADIAGDGDPPMFAIDYSAGAMLDDQASRTEGGTTTYYLRDGLNSVTEILNTDETVSATYGYYPYGSIRTTSGASTNRFTYTGRSQEVDSALMYYRTRYYDPYTGRFLKKDRYKGSLDNPLSLNQYNYVHSNPANYVDPVGRARWNQAAWGIWDTAVGTGQYLTGAVTVVVSGGTCAVCYVQASLGLSQVHKGVQDTYYGLNEIDLEGESGVQRVSVAGADKVSGGNLTETQKQTVRDVSGVTETTVGIGISLHGLASGPGSGLKTGGGGQLQFYSTQTGQYMSTFDGSTEVAKYGVDMIETARGLKSLQHTLDRYDNSASNLNYSTGNICAY